jgi:hypothetical protein
MTQGQLLSKRDEFWDTAPAFNGRPEIWQVVEFVVEFVCVLCLFLFVCLFSLVLLLCVPANGRAWCVHACLIVCVGGVIFMTEDGACLCIHQIKETTLLHKILSG